MTGSALNFLGIKDRRTTFLSVGVTLCVLVAAICAAPLAFVKDWIAVWLLCLLSILTIGTFGIWAFHAIRNPRLLDSEQNREQMAAIQLLGANRDGGPALVEQIVGAPLISNPEMKEE